MYFACSAISRIEMKASFNFAKLTPVCSVRLHSFSQKANELRGSVVWVLLFQLQAGKQKDTMYPVSIKKEIVEC